MKSFPCRGSQNDPRFRKTRTPKVLPEQFRQIAHQLLNNLSVLNLCSYRLRSQLDALSAVALSADTELLQRAVDEATICAERMSEVIAQYSDGSPTQKSSGLKAAKPGSNVVQLFAGKP